MPGYLRQATASQSRALGPFIDDTDFKTPKTGLTIANTDIALVVNGGASGTKNSGGGTHRVNGVYGVTFDATDTATVGEMEVSVAVSSALIVFDKFFVIEEAAFDMLFAASALGYIANAPVNVAQFGGSNLTSASGIPEVKVNNIAANAITATSIATDAITSGKLAANCITSSELDSTATNAIADALLDRTGAIETGLTPREALRLNAAALAGKLSGAATTTVTIRNAVADSKNRIVATVDADGNRTAVTTDVS